MTKKKNSDLDLKINSDTVLLFDMDGTLIDTDFANFLSYKEAIKSIINSNKEIDYIPNQRFNRTILEYEYPNLTKQDYNKIIQQKEINYKNFLIHTKLNESIAEILINYSKTNKTILVTNCREDRALLTLNFHNLTDKFSYLLFKQISKNGNRINKYDNAIKKFGLSTQNVLVFENEVNEKNDAIHAGILIENIINP